jgi:hypothetical protein
MNPGLGRGFFCREFGAKVSALSIRHPIFDPRAWLPDSLLARRPGVVYHARLRVGP